MCVAARRLLCVCVVEEEVLSQLVASTVMSSVLCGETFYMGGGVKAKRFRPPSLSESGRRGVGACSMSSSVQETVTNEKKTNTRLFHVVVHGGLLCCKFNLVSCRS